jgi:hypothetical protein
VDATTPIRPQRSTLGRAEALAVALRRQRGLVAALQAARRPAEARAAESILELPLEAAR